MTVLNFTNELLNQCISHSQSRLEFWVEFIRRAQVQRMVEVGVYRGEFAETVLQRCESVSRYYMLDPWRHLDDWNKPRNHDASALERCFEETKARTEFAAARRVILRGKTTEVIDEIADGELDFAYIDGDHTLKGITIDLIRVYAKLRNGGFMGGDDFDRSVWENGMAFEPTLVFPFAVYFAEAVGVTIYALPNAQFCLQKNDHGQFAFVDLTGKYDNLGLRSQFRPGRLLDIALGQRYPNLMQLIGKTRKLLVKPQPRPRRAA